MAYSNVHVQLVTNAKLKQEAQEIIKKYGLLNLLRKEDRSLIWNAVILTLQTCSTGNTWKHNKKIKTNITWKKQIVGYKVLTLQGNILRSPYFGHIWEKGWNFGNRDITEPCKFIENEGIHVFLDKDDATIESDTLKQVPFKQETIVVPVTCDSCDFIAAGEDEAFRQTALFHAVYFS